jgi:hypothetical protein
MRTKKPTILGDHGYALEEHPQHQQLFGTRTSQDLSCV